MQWMRLMMIRYGMTVKTMVVVVRKMKVLTVKIETVTLLTF